MNGVTARVAAAGAADGRIPGERDPAEGHLGAAGHEQAAAQARAAATAAGHVASLTAGRALGAHVRQGEVVDFNRSPVDHEAALGADAVQGVAVADDGQAGAGHQADLVEGAGEGDGADRTVEADHIVGVGRRQ